MPNNEPFEGALIFRIATSSTPSCRAALLISGSSIELPCIPPGPRCAQRGGVLVATERPRNRSAIG
jgi:hypothetical protein